MASIFKRLAAAAAGSAVCVVAWADIGTDADRPAAVIPLASETSPKLTLYPPLPEALARGVVISSIGPKTRESSRYSATTRLMYRRALATCT
jgi:hypothetical protein